MPPALYLEYKALAIIDGTWNGWAQTAEVMAWNANNTNQIIETIYATKGVKPPNLDPVTGQQILRMLAGKSAKGKKSNRFQNIADREAQLTAEYNRRNGK